MADAGKIFLNDNLLPLAYMHTEGQQIIQLWHGAVRLSDLVFLQKKIRMFVNRLLRLISM